MLPSMSKVSLATCTSKTSSISSSSLSTTASSQDNNNNNNNNNSQVASQRGQDAVALLPSYLADARAVTQYDPITAPEGALQLGVAESQLVEDLLVPMLNELAASTPFTADCIYYQPTPGRPALKQAMASYLQDLLQLSATMDAEGLIVGAGCNAVLENLCFALACQGDTVFIPTPYYAAFEFDLVARAGLQVMPVSTMEYAATTTTGSNKKSIDPAQYYPTVEALDAAYSKAKSPPKILLLSHPQNPLGVAYPPHVVQDCIEWCRAHQIHSISDEIYAGSITDAANANFVSALELASTPNSDGDLGLGEYVHLVYALSKDFALSGLRVGVAYSENSQARLPLQKLNDLCQISSHTQLLVEGMLLAREGEQRWTTIFRKEHQSRLRARADALQALLDEFDVPYLPATCGLFVWIDLSQYLPNNNDDDDSERERALYLQLVQDYGLLFTPGLSMRHEQPGFFRCVFSAATNDEYELALQRLRKFLQEQQ